MEKEEGSPVRACTFINYSIIYTPMLTEARVARDASFIGMKAYSRGTHSRKKTTCVVSIYIRGDHGWKENYYLSTAFVEEN